MTTKPKFGTVREDGFVYFGKKKAGSGEHWISPEAYHRAKVGSTLSSARRNAPKRGVIFDLDVDYLISIFPEDGKCPALGMPLVWGDRSGRDCSPSLDRIVPHRGYTKGNVRWMSQLANQIKTSATPEQVQAVAEFLRN